VTDRGTDDAHRLAVRFVDEQSGRNDLLGRVASLEALAGVVSRRLEGARTGSRFPLLQLIGRIEPLTASECEVLAREVTRLRHVLAPVPARVLDEEADAGRGLDEWIHAANGAERPRTLADAFAWPLFVLEHIARLGAASRRGARFEVGDAELFAAARTPLKLQDGRVL
jgi:hypothetical protein